MWLYVLLFCGVVAAYSIVTELYDLAGPDDDE